MMTTVDDALLQNEESDR